MICKWKFLAIIHDVGQDNYLNIKREKYLANFHILLFNSVFEAAGIVMPIICILKYVYTIYFYFYR